jgi:sugar lactone lactonase YvrE
MKIVHQLLIPLAMFVAACGGGGGGDAPAPAPPPPPPAITVQPQGTTVIDGQTATFQVVATGPGLQFAWRRNGVPIAGAGSSTYMTPPTVHATDDGAQYSVTVSNASGSLTSANATLSVTPIPVTIGSQPQAVAVADGGAASYSVTASGTAPITYQWRRNGVNVAGATGSTYVTPPLVLAVDNGAQYSVVVSNPAGSATSAAAGLVIDPVLAQITSNPSAVTVPDGAQAIFSVVARGTAPLSYQWLRSGTPIAGATSSDLALTASFADSGTQIAVRITNPAGSVTSGTAVLTVDPLAPSISAQPQDSTVARGGTASFSIAVAGGTPPVNIQWQRSDDAGSTWRDIAGAVGPNYVLAVGAGFSEFGSLFRARVTNPAASSTSRAARLTVLGSLTILAGAVGGPGYFDGMGPVARLSFPSDVAADSTGNVYVADGSGGLRRVSPLGEVSTLVPGAGLNVTGVAVEPGGTVIFADTVSSAIRRVHGNGSVTLVAGGSFGNADGQGAAAQFRNPRGLAVDVQGNIFVADTDNHAIRRITTAGMVSTFGGLAGTRGSATGPNNQARFDSPHDVAIDSLGTLYVADTGNSAIRRMLNGETTTFAGLPQTAGTQDGATNAALFNAPLGVAVDAAGTVFVADSYLPANTIRRIANGTVTTLVGQAGFSGYVDATGASARFLIPAGATVEPGGNVLVSEISNATVRRISPGAVVTTLAGLGAQRGASDLSGPAARFASPGSVILGTGGDLFVSDVDNRTIRRIRVADAFVSTFAGLPGQLGLTLDGVGTAARFNQPGALAADVAGNLYVADAPEHVIRRISPAGEVTTFAGAATLEGSADGIGAAARFKWPVALAFDGQGGLYVADLNNTVRRIDLASREVRTIAGTPGASGTRDGAGGIAQFLAIRGLAVEPRGDVLISDMSRVRRMTPGGVVTTVAGVANSIGSDDGEGAQARFYSLGPITLDSTGNAYISDFGNSTIRRVTPGGTVTTLIGQPGARTVRTGPNALVNDVSGLVFLPNGALVLTSENAVLLY